jgi:hypothetical protein
VDIASTKFNERLSALIRNSIAADQSYIAGQAAFWRLVGFGVLAFGVEAAIGLCLYGYSYVVANSDSLNLMSSTFSRALTDAHLNASAEGVVQIEPREISLAKGQTISFDTNSRLLLDPAAKIQVDGEIQVQTPSISAPQSIPARTPPRVPLITNFTVFKKVPFEDGSVMTGWVFLTSIQRSPTSQYCYYTENAETSGLDVVLDIAEDEKMETPKTMPKGFDILAAFNRCVWFRNDRP